MASIEVVYTFNLTANSMILKNFVEMENGLLTPTVVIGKVDYTM